MAGAACSGGNHETPKVAITSAPPKAADSRRIVMVQILNVRKVALAVSSRPIPLLAIDADATVVRALVVTRHEVESGFSRIFSELFDKRRQLPNHQIHISLCPIASTS